MDGAFARTGERYQDASGTRPATVALPGVNRLRSRHTRFVGAMKLVLPLIACALAGLVFIWPQIEDHRRGFRLSVAPVAVDDVRGQRVVNARYSGTDKKNRPFVVTADEAVQANGDPEQVRLRNPQADLSLNGGAWLALTAPSGLLRRKGNTLSLFGGIVLFRDDGYELKTESATVDLKEGTASGSRPVTGQGPLGSMAARGFELLEAGQRVLLTGKAKLVLNSTAEPGNR